MKRVSFAAAGRALPGIAAGDRLALEVSGIGRREHTIG